MVKLSIKEKVIKMKKRLIFTTEEMKELNIKTLKSRGVEVNDMAEIAYRQQSKYSSNVTMDLCIRSVERVLSFRDVFHQVQFAAEVDRLAEEKAFKFPMQDILHDDLGLFGIDETLGLDLSGFYGVIGITNFGDIDVNKTGIIAKLNEEGKKEGVCHTFLDDIVGAIAAAASTRVAQVLNEELALENPDYSKTDIYDFIEEK